MLTVEMLPAEHGDCLWVEYGDPGRPSVLLIDGGTGAPATTRGLGRRIADRLGHDHPAALAVVTHVDADHITGVLDLLEAPGRDLPFAEVWFNGWEHLAPGVRGPLQGERLRRTPPPPRCGSPAGSPWPRASAARCRASGSATPSAAGGCPGTPPSTAGPWW